MMKKFLFVLMAGLLLLTTACNDRKAEVAEFAKKVAQYARDNQPDSLAAVYPDMDSLEITLAPVSDSVIVDQIPDKENMYLVKLGDATLEVQCDDEGKMTVVKSHGLFTYDEAEKETAKARGQYVDSLPDLENARRMADGEFLAYFEKMKAEFENVPNPLKVGKYKVTKQIEFMMDLGQGCVVVTNTSNEAVSGSDYQLSYRMEHLAPMEPETTSREVVKGKDIPANGTAQFNIDWTGRHYPEDNSFKIIWMAKPKEYVPTGKEYDQYLESKKK